jgi:hypothetical protein
VWWAGHVLVLVEIAVATRRFVFFQDDFVFVSEGRGEILRNGVVHRQPLSLDYLRAALFEHFSPIARLGFWVLGRSDSPQVWARMLVLALVGLLVVCFGILCRSILGRTFEALLLTMIAAQGLVVVHLAAWTTASLNMIPALALCALSLAAAVRFLRDRESRWYAVASLALFGIGLLGYELTMFLPVFIGSWFLLCVGPALGFAAMLSRIRETVTYWATFVVLGGAAAVNFKVNYMASGLPKPTVHEFVATLWHAWWQGLFPSVLGVSAVGHGAGILGLVAVLLWIGFAAAGLLHVGPRILGPIALALVAWLLCTAALAWGRAAINTPWVGIDLFYAAMPLLALVAAVAEALRMAGRTKRRTTDHRLRVVSGLAVVVLTTAGLTQVHSRQATDPNGVASASRAFQRTFLHDVSGHKSAPAVVSAPAPEAVVLRSFYPYNYISRNVGILTDRVRWDTADGGPLYRANLDGRLVPVALTERARANLARIRAFNADRSSNGRCYVMRSSTSRVTARLASPVSGPNLAVRIKGTIDGDSAVRPFVVLPDQRRMSATGTLTQWARGDIRAILAPPTDVITGFGVTGLVPGTSVCFESVVVGSLTDVPGR